MNDTVPNTPDPTDGLQRILDQIGAARDIVQAILDRLEAEAEK